MGAALADVLRANHLNGGLMLPLDARDTHVHQILLLLHLDHTRRVPDLGGCVLCVICRVACGVWRVACAVIIHSMSVGTVTIPLIPTRLFSRLLGEY